MKILVCGAGRITDELLKRIGANWEITLIEKDEAKPAPSNEGGGIEKRKLSALWMRQWK